MCFKTHMFNISYKTEHLADVYYIYGLSNAKYYYATIRNTAKLKQKVKILWAVFDTAVGRVGYSCRPCMSVCLSVSASVYVCVYRKES